MVGLEHATPQIRVKHYTTEPLLDHNLFTGTLSLNSINQQQSLGNQKYNCNNCNVITFSKVASSCYCNSDSSLITVNESNNSHDQKWE